MGVVGCVGVGTDVYDCFKMYRYIETDGWPVHKSHGNLEGIIMQRWSEIGAVQPRRSLICR